MASAKKLFVRKLSYAEKGRLLLFERINNKKAVRARIILMSASGMKVEIISILLNKNKNTVRKWIKQFNKVGISGLNSKKQPGATPKFTDRIRKRIKDIVDKKPENYGLPYKSWSLPKLKHFLEEKKIVTSICVQTVKNILKKEMGGK